MLCPAQFVVALAACAYLVYWRIALAHRNQRSWESLVERLLHGSLRVELTADANLGQFWTMQKRARIMAETADYAARNGCEDRTTISAIRSDAYAIRFSAWRQMLSRMQR